MIRVLFCGEREADWLLLQTSLYGTNSIAPHFHLSWEPSLEGARRALLRNDSDVYLVDEGLGGGQGIELLSLLPSSITTPILLLSAGGVSLPEETLAIQAGAADVLLRDEVSPRQLRKAVVHALARASVAKRSTDIPCGVVPQGLLQQRLENALSRERLTRAKVALLAILVDHLQGSLERLTSAIAERLLSCSREVDTVCYTQAGQFLVLLEGLTHDAQADIQADRLLLALQAPLSLQGEELLPRVCIGIAVAPEDGETPTELIRSVEEALRNAQREGGRSARHALGPLNEKAQRRWLLRRALEGALERGEFSLHYQPQVELRNERVVGAEALLRWRSAQLGPVSPAEFIPLLEATNQIETIGLWVLHEACTQGRIWQDAGCPIKIGVNASAKQLTSPDFGPACEQILRQTGFSPELLGLEITEGLLLEGSSHVRELLNKLRSLGVSISIDDFGTGYASLSYIKRFPMDVIKIDKEFVRGVPLDVENAAITSAILALGHSLGLRVVAEGVEHDSELEFLRSLGCTAAQGFYYAKPMPCGEFESWVRSRN
ncbi:MAG: EAL domain-containing protein [Myxococcales bacterium]|nr:EAL domain-containing protein [Polyangiaceae bacterium]MDW8248403.1 EAL domain-containing protein [Myxococcales bacterium]